MIAAAIPTLSDHELALRLGLSALCGALVGLEREWRDRAAGLRTHMLVTLGSTIFTLLSLYGAQEWIQYSQAAGGASRTLYTADPGRIAAQIVSGIGFIGAGAIWRSQNSVHGVTTAASLWVMASIGMAVGMGWHWTAVEATAGILLVLLLVRFISHHVRAQGADRDLLELVVSVRISGSKIAGAVSKSLSEADLSPSRTKLSQRQVGEDRRRSRTLTCIIDYPGRDAAQRVFDALAEMEGVIGVDVESR